ncbi:MAG: gas vesicle protein [Candidatus Nanopelagicales bacterium]
MEPTIDTKAGLGDLLERVLDRGVVVRLDLIISVAGIPLVGLSLHAALASIETMNAYGMFGEWDKSSRREAAAAAQDDKLELAPGEKLSLEQFAMVRSQEGISRTWKPGRVYITNDRIVLLRRMPFEILASIDLADIAATGVLHYTQGGVDTEIICLADSSGKLVPIRTSEPELFKAALADLLRRRGIVTNDLSTADLQAAFPDVRAEGQLWHDSGSEGGWRPGWAAIDEESFTFWSDFERRPLAKVALAELLSVTVEQRDLGPALGARNALVLVLRDSRELLFSGQGIAMWSTELEEALVRASRS